MTMIFHLFKTDVRRLRVLLGGWLLLLLFQCVLIGSTGNPADRVMQGIFSGASDMIPVLQVILLIVIVPLLIHEEPLVGTTAFWFSRPIHRSTLLLSKSLFVAMLIALPLLAEVGVLVTSGTTANDILLAAPEIVLNHLSLVMMIALLAIFTPNFGRFAVTAVIGLVVWFVFLRAFFWVGSFHGIHSGIKEIALLKTRGVVECLVAVLGGGAVVAHQYLTRKTVRSLVGTGFVAVGFIFAFGIWPWSFFDLPRLPVLPATVDVSTFQVELVRTEFREDRIRGDVGGGRRLIDGTIVTKGLSDGYVIRPVQVRSSLRDAQRKNVSCFRYSTIGVSRPSVPADIKAIEVALGRVPVVNSGFEPNDLTSLFGIYEAEYKKYAQQPLRLSAEIDFVVSRYAVDLAIPVVRGARFDHGSEHATITDVLRQGSGVEIVVQQRDAELLFDRTSELTGGFSVSSKRLKPIGTVYLLRNQKRNEAVWIKRFDKEADDVIQIRPGRLMKKQLRLRFGSEQNVITPELDAAWLAEAELVRLQLIPVGTLSKKLVVENFRLDGENSPPAGAELTPPFDPARFARIGLPENATKAQVKDYVNSILMASQYRGDWEEQDPQAAMLLKIGSENLDVLLSAVGRNSPTRKFQDYAIRKLARREDKVLILAALATNPNLAELVHKFHWRDEAFATLIAGVKDEHETWLPALWIELVASFRDPATYPDLKAFLLRSINQREVFEMIKGLPGIDLSDTAEAIWKKGQYRKSCDLLDASAIAAEFGHEDALAALVRVLAQDDDEGYRSMASSYVREYTFATGDNTALIAWYEANKGRLTFDAQQKKFLVSSAKASPGQ